MTIIADKVPLDKIKSDDFNSLLNKIQNGTDLDVIFADSLNHGFLTASDWNTFNGKQPAGDYITAETDPDFNAWLIATPPLYTGGWYDTIQSSVSLSGFTDDLSYENPLTFNFPLTRTVDTIGLGYNTTNLKITSNELNTIQNIDSTASPTFANVSSSNDATANNHLVRLDQMNSAISGLSWQERILDQLNFVTSEPASPTIGDRYINTTTGDSSETTQAVTATYIYVWNGDDWTEYVPVEGWTVWDVDGDTNYTFNGLAWVEFGSTVSHNNTTGLQGGTTSEYYHLTQTEYGYISGVNAQSLLTTGTPTFDQLTVDNINLNGSAITGMSDANTTLTAYAGRAIAIEGVNFDGNNITGVTNLGLTAGRVTNAWIDNLVVTNDIVGVINVIGVTATTDDTCSVALFENATGDQAIKTDAGITYNATTNVLTVAGKVNAANTSTIIQPIMVHYNVYAPLSYVLEWQTACLNSSTTAWYDPVFIAPFTGSFKLVHVYTGNTAGRDNNMTIYAGKSTASAHYSLTNCINGETPTFTVSTAADNYVNKTAAFSMNAGDILYTSCRKTNDSGSGYFIMVGAYLEVQ
jgi:hypothetical protein